MPASPSRSFKLPQSTLKTPLEPPLNRRGALLEIINSALTLNLTPPFPLFKSPKYNRLQTPSNQPLNHLESTLKFAIKRPFPTRLQAVVLALGPDSKTVGLDDSSGLADRGTYALVGAAAALSGLTRLTIAATVLLPPPPPPLKWPRFHAPSLVFPWNNSGCSASILDCLVPIS